MTELVPPATRFVDLPAGFPMLRGGALDGARIGYEAFGTLSDDRDNVLVILPGLSANAHAASHDGDPSPGWWEAMVGPGRPVDTDHWYVVCVNPLGSCKGSTGPASTEPATGRPYRTGFPALSIEDIADAVALTVRALGFERIACVIGLSMGAMSSLALLARHPGLAANHVSISGSVHSAPFSIAIRSQQRAAIRSDPDWQGGEYDDERYPQRGMNLARKLGLISYRSAQEWDVRFARRRVRPDGAPVPRAFEPEFEIEAYLDCHAGKFVRDFDPNSYLYLSRSIDWFDLGESFGCSPDEALRRITLDRALVIGVWLDLLFPVRQQQQIADGLAAGGADVDFVALDSLEGHDAFLVDVDRFGPPLERFLSELRPAGLERLSSLSTSR